ncbi:MAG TPA: hypothetical protein DCE41_05080 [Cytophagales bacterium]|nr:hypothetical protein [Cytophagales bacterium]HAA23995.1 hypothetical protein [Cytophagales bacterium]HAP59364.1 hypothetical protein [Cytophagales bacterium]
MAQKIKSTGKLGLLTVLCLATWTCSAQRIDGVTVTLHSSSISFPFTRWSALRPGVELGVTWNQPNKPQATGQWNTYVGWFYHENLDQNLYVRGEYQFAYQFQNTVRFFAPVGLGYMHSFHAQPTFEQQADGSIQKATQWGRPHAILNLGLGAEYLGWNQVAPFVKYEAMIQSPFVSTVPVGPRSFLKIGTHINLN